MWDHKNTEETPISDIIGEYTWVFRDGAEVEPGFLEDDEGGITIELKDASSPTAMTNLTGKIKYSHFLECDILEFQEKLDDDEERQKSAWSLVLKYTGDDPDFDGADCVDSGIGHEFFICKQVDDHGTPFITLIVDADPDIILVGKKRVAGRKKMLTAKERKRVEKGGVSSSAEKGEDIEASSVRTKTGDSLAATTPEAAKEISKEDNQQKPRLKDNSVAGDKTSLSGSPDVSKANTNAKRKMTDNGVETLNGTGTSKKVRKS
ncbi:hypothetical protein SISSUDRAFT_572338 [Sistotremastrum suecicum HHB10207 ss-3]|uniref:Uncharacterized protein n=1 Tax=Sistotremastrum suecicum HHB10207 ss-3 TaxID=1314776 RepID=A0A166ERU8_9AGAM|nr:hypothetical protein SISSUDRAFT_572338 [Sistotremastrum suecicum HHB10207 ss-3]